MRTSLFLLAATLSFLACRRPPQRSAPAAVEERATIGRIYYWRARPGKIDEYSRYIREMAEPIDHEAQRHGAFISVTTTERVDSARSSTHIRLFKLRDSLQLAGLAVALSDAGIALEPDSAKRRVRGAYSATLRDRVGEATVDLRNGELADLPMPGFAGLPVREGWLRGADGVSLFYRMVGTGKDTIVDVPGGPDGGLREGYDLEALATMGHALLLYDQRGTGGSELVRDSGRLGIDRHTADLGTVLQHFHLTRAKLLGISQGAAIVARWAAEHPEVTDRVVLVSPLSPISDSDLWSVLGRVRAPALVVEGELSTATLGGAREFARALTQGSLSLIPGSGQRSWLDRPELFRASVDAFLKRP